MEGRKDGGTGFFDEASPRSARLPILGTGENRTTGIESSERTEGRKGGKGDFSFPQNCTAKGFFSSERTAEKVEGQL